VRPRAETVIVAGKTARAYWSDLWRYRELFGFLAWRDISVRYKQTAIGAAWAILRPLLTLVVFTVVFSVIARLPAPTGVPYAVLVLAGLLPWQFMSSAMSEAANSLVDNERIISKVYFPRLIIPGASAMVAIADGLVSLVLLVSLFGWYGFSPDWRFITIPVWFAFAFLAAIGPGLLLTALNVKYRDVRYAIPFLLQVGLYISPVGYSSELVPGQWRTVYFLNPFAGVIDGFRWSLLGGAFQADWRGIALSAAVCLALLVSGVRYFRATERYFADLI
jgi:lipopolysaccharide transport system permease protein